MYYDLRFKINDSHISTNEAREMIAKAIALQGNTKERQLDLKMLSAKKLEKVKNGTAAREMKLRFDVSNKSVVRLQEIQGVKLIGLSPTDIEEAIEAQKYDDGFYSVKGHLGR